MRQASNIYSVMHGIIGALLLCVPTYLGWSHDGITGLIAGMVVGAVLIDLWQTYLQELPDE